MLYTICFTPSPVPPAPAPQQTVAPSCDQLLALDIDSYLLNYKGFTGTGSPLWGGLSVYGTPGTDAGTYLVDLGNQTNVDPAFILGIGRAESSLGTNPGNGGQYNVYGNSGHFNSNIYTDYRTPTIDAFNLIEGYVQGGVGLDTKSMYIAYEGESKTNPKGFQQSLDNLNSTDSALFGNLGNVKFSCSSARQQQLTVALGGR